MHRFFLPEGQFSESEITLPVELSRQIARVLRLQNGSVIVLLDNQGSEYLSTLVDVNPENCLVRVNEKHQVQSEPQTHMTLMIGLTQREKFEWILQKCTEIGVTHFQPILTSRSLIQKSEDCIDKYPRWKKIITEAAEQSHRGKIPELLPVQKFNGALECSLNKNSLKMILWEDEERTGLKDILRTNPNRQVVLLVGPEGGLSAEEVSLAQQSGFLSVSLGRRILRMETAAMLAAGLVLYELG